MNFILGMHRSGTSLLTRLLCSGGELYPGKNIHPGNWENPEGYLINVSILQGSGGDWNKIPDTITLTAPQRDAMREANRTWKKTGVSLVKDPRLCITLSDWVGVLVDEKEKINVCVLLRNPVDCARSMERLYNLPLRKGMDLYEKYYFGMMVALRSPHVRFVTIFYELLMGAPVRTTAPAAELFGIDNTKLDHKVIDHKLWRHRAARWNEKDYKNVEFATVR